MHPPVSLRLLGPADAPLLEHVAADVFDHPVNPRRAAEFLSDPRHHLVVALLNGEVIGMASAVDYLHPDKPRELWVNEIGVTPAWQRQGVGKQLLDALLAHGRALGCSEAWLATGHDNIAARRLYASLKGREAPVVYVTFDLSTAEGMANNSPSYDNTVPSTGKESPT